MRRVSRRDPAGQTRAETGERHNSGDTSAVNRPIKDAMGMGEK